MRTLAARPPTITKAWPASSWRTSSGGTPKDVLPGHGALAGDATAAIGALGVDLDRVGHSLHGARPNGLYSRLQAGDPER